MNEGDRKLNRRFLDLAVPNILSNLLVPLASAVDVALLGHLASIADLAGVALATVLFDYVLWTFGFLRMATTGLTAQARGRLDVEAEHLVLLRGLSLALAVGLALVILQWPLREIGFLVLRGGEDLKLAGRAYFDARIWGAPFTLANYALIGWLLGQERARAALLLSAVAHGSNVILDFWFLAHLGWGAAGAGAATALSQCAAFAVGLVCVREALRPPALRRRLPRLAEPEALRAFFGLGADITVRTLLLISTFAVFTNLAATMGTVVLAATTVLRQVVMIVAWFIDGYAFAVESLAGVFRGAGDLGALRRTLRLAFAWGVGTAAFFAAGIAVAPRPLLSILTDHPPVLAVLDRTAWWLIPVLLLSAPAYVLDGYFLGVTEGATLRRAMLASTLVGFVPLAAVAAARSSVDLLWLALSAFMLARTWTLGRALSPSLQAAGRD